MSSSKAACFSGPDINARFLNNSLSVAFRITAAKTSGANIPAPLLQIPIMLIRWAARSLGPNKVIYGFAAVCKMASPVPRVNKPSKNIS